jgi:hypothetical protein
MRGPTLNSKTGQWSGFDRDAPAPLTCSGLATLVGLIRSLSSREAVTHHRIAAGATRLPGAA